MIFLNFYNYLILMPLLILTNLMIYSTSSWMSMWIIMEMNLIIFITMMIFDKNNSSKNIMEYFLVQSFNSYVFLISTFLMNFNNFFTLFLNYSILMKLGMPPFYLWYLNIMKFLNWMNFFIMTTFQKIIPFHILNSLINMNLFLNINVVLFIFSSFYSSLKGIKLSNLKLLMTYSSIIQMSWIMILMMISETTYLIYLLIYSIISMNIYAKFMTQNLSNLKDLNLMKISNYYKFIEIIILIFSLSSLPPTLGFLMKWISIHFMYNYLNFTLILIMILNSLISSFFYLRISFNSMTFKNYSKKKNFLNLIHKMENSKFFYMNWLLIFMLIMFEII